jgi:hypothetical protein
MFNRTSMRIYRDATGALTVDPVRITREGTQQFRMSNEPPIGSGLPPNEKPFFCDPPLSEPDGPDRTTTLLKFDPSFFATWHNEPTDPFDMRRMVDLTMDVVLGMKNGVELTTPEFLSVRLLCREHRTLTTALLEVAQAVVTAVVTLAVTVAVAIVHFLQHAFGFSKRARLVSEERAELAADGPEGVGKDLRG